MSTQFEAFGKYVLLEKLATGGMAEVFLARGTGTAGIGKFFAIKRILPQYADSPEFIEMFKDEAKIAINLSHSNIVSIHEFGVEKGQFFLVMDYVEGRNLRQILNKMKKSGLQFSIDQIIFIVKEVGAGLDHAHRCIDGSTGKPLNITHRDMSPQNVMVSFEGEVKVVDFGIAKAESQLETTRAGTLKGKFGYMSPEQAEGQPVDLRTDIFSLGIVLWELLANDRLFVANNEINTLRKIRDCQIPSLRKINPNIHTELERIVQKSLARDRNLRYQTGAALHRDLNRFLNRQYPDFSSQDFAVFIKSVFADEILSLRKRLVDYAKLNISNQPAPTRGKSNFDDRTALLNTSTNSLVVSDPQAEVTESSLEDKSASGVTASEVSREQMVVQQSDPPQQSSWNGEGGTPVPSDFAGGQGPNFTPSPSRPNTPPMDVKTNTKTDVPEVTNSDPNKLPPPRRNGMQMVLDHNAIEAEMEKELALRSKPSKRESEDGPSLNMRTKSYASRRSIPGAAPTPSRSTSMRFATLVVFGLLCSSVYAYLVKYFTPMMTDVIIATDPYLHEFHTALGVDIQATNISSTLPNVVKPPVAVAPPTPAPNGATPPPATTTNPTATATPTPPPTATTPVAATGPKPTSEDVAGPTTGLVVISNPSGAEIWLDDKNTGLVTPSRLDIPSRGNFSIIVRKRGYTDFKVRDTNKETVGHRLTANLLKANVAFLDLEVFPPQDVVLSINGKVLSAHPPIQELQVQANTQLKIRAETRNGTAFDEVTVTLPVDKRQAIQLNPRKSIRLPSNTPNEE